MAFAVVLGGCDVDSILDVPTPDIVPGEIAGDPSNLPGLRNGVLFEFARAYTGASGGNEFPGIIGTSGVFADEQWYSSTFEEMKEFDERSVQTKNSGLEETFRNVQRARNWATVTGAVYAESDEANSAGHALVSSLAGYAQVFLAENFCSGVPLSTTELNGELVYGEGLTTVELLERALQQFETAEGIADQAGAYQSLAKLGQARVLLDLGRFDEAATIAASIPSSFAYLVEFSEAASGQNNGIWSQINSNLRSSLASEEGSDNIGIRYFNADPGEDEVFTIDPRVPVPSSDIGIGTVLPVFRTGKYSQRGADVPLASYIEAQLIVAENALDGGNSAAYLPILNDLRADVTTLLPMIGITPPAGAALAPLTDPGTAEGRVLQLFRERALWLHLTAHRLSDIRRLIRQYGFEPGEVFPTGETIFGQPYGTDVNMPIPFIEGNNPQFSGQCIDREA